MTQPFIADDFFVLLAKVAVSALLATMACTLIAALSGCSLGVVKGEQGYRYAFEYGPIDQHREEKSFSGKRGNSFVTFSREEDEEKMPK